MKKILILIAIVLSIGASAQTYVNGSVSYYNGAGSFGAQAMPTVEVGRYLQEDFTLGVAAGRTSFKNGFSFIELRPTFYYSSGKFSQGFTIGGGYVFKAEDNFLVETTVSTNYQFTPHWGVGIFIGQYNFNGKLFASEYTFAGLGFTYIFNGRNKDKKEKTVKAYAADTPERFIYHNQ